MGEVANYIEVQASIKLLIRILKKMFSECFDLILYLLNDECCSEQSNLLLHHTNIYFLEQSDLLPIILIYIF